MGSIGLYMEYINIVNDNANVIINDDFRNLSVIEVANTPWKRAFNMERLNLDYPNENYYPQYYKIDKNYNELIFVAPNGKEAFNKAFCQVNTPYQSILLTPTELMDSLIYDPIYSTPPREREYDGPFKTIQSIKDRHSFKILKFGERFPSGRSGIEIYNQNGGMVFTSNNRYLRIKDFIFNTNVFRPYHIINQWGATIVDWNHVRRDVVSWDQYRDDPGYHGMHCHMKRYKYDEPIAICALSLPAPNIALTNKKFDSISSFSYLSFADECTLDFWAEIDNGYADSTSDDPAIGGSTISYSEFRGDSDILALMIIAKNDYL